MVKVWTAARTQRSECAVLFLPALLVADLPRTFRKIPRYFSMDLTEESGRFQVR